MFGRSDKWWLREIEKRDRAHEAQIADLLRTIAHLAAKPLPDTWQPQPAVTPPDPDQSGPPLEDI